MWRCNIVNSCDHDGLITGGLITGGLITGGLITGGLITGGLRTGGLIRKRGLSMTSARGTAHKKLK